MDSQFIVLQKEKLTEKRQNLTKEVNRLKKEDAFKEEAMDPGGRRFDEEDDVAEATQHSNTQSLVVEIQKDLKQVEKALKSIEDGTYGTDEITGETISEERLTAYPEATTSN